MKTPFNFISAKKLYNIYFISFQFSMFIFSPFCIKQLLFARNWYWNVKLLSVKRYFVAAKNGFKIYGICFCSRVSVMRGQVITPQGLGIVGIRVSVDKDSRFGFTLTRTGGWWVEITNFIYTNDDSCSVHKTLQLESFIKIKALHFIAKSLVSRSTTLSQRKI